MGTTPCFSAVFTRGSNFDEFQCAFLDDETCPKWSLHKQKESVSSPRIKFYFDIDREGISGLPPLIKNR